jgi:hypothetical protein
MKCENNHWGWWWIVKTSIEVGEEMHKYLQLYFKISKNIYKWKEQCVIIIYRIYILSYKTKKYIFYSKSSLTMFDLHYDNLWSSEVVITAFKIIGVESQFTKAIFSVSITFTDACQRRFFLLQICRVVGDLIEPHYGSHVRDPMSWRYNDMIYAHALFVQLDYRWHG